MRLMLLLAVLSVSGCATSVIDYKRGTDFSVYQQASIRKDDSQKETSIDTARIEAALVKYLPQQGLAVVQTEAQLEVVGRLVEYRRYESNQVSWGVGGVHDNLGVGLSAPMSADERKQYRLEIEFVDSATKQVVWKARSAQAMDENFGAGKRDAWIDKNVARLLEGYPPK
jgi:hypothetical protein